MTGFQRQQNRAFLAYQLAYLGRAYQSENHGLRGNPLGNRPFGNQSKTAVSVETPWKPRLGNTRRKCGVSLFTAVFTGGCLPWAKNAVSLDTWLDTLGQDAELQPGAGLLRPCCPKYLGESLALYFDFHHWRE